MLYELFPRFLLTAIPMWVSMMANSFRVFLIAQFSHVILQRHAPIILIAMGSPILRWYLLSSVLTYRKLLLSFPLFYDSSPQCLLYHLGELIVLRTIQGICLAGTFLVLSNRHIVASSLLWDLESFLPGLDAFSGICPSCKWAITFSKSLRATPAMCYSHCSRFLLFRMVGVVLQRNVPYWQVLHYPALYPSTLVSLIRIHSQSCSLVLEVHVSLVLQLFWNIISSFTL